MSFADTFLHIKMSKSWDEKWNFLASENAFSCFAFCSSSCLWIHKSFEWLFFKRKIFYHGNSFMSLDVEGKRYIYVLCMRTWNVFSSCHHGNTCEMIFRLFAHSSAVWKCIFPKRSVLLYFPSHLISTFQTAFLLPFPFLKFSFRLSFEDDNNERIFLSRKHVTEPDNMKIMLFKILLFFDSNLFHRSRTWARQSEAELWSILAEAGLNKNLK